MDILEKTIFLDIDGTLIKHHGQGLFGQLKQHPELLPDVLGKLKEWDERGYTVILTTGRRECSRHVTEDQLAQMGIFYDQLIMGIGRGERVVINDCKTDGASTTRGITIKRNAGLTGVEL